MARPRTALANPAPTYVVEPGLLAALQADFDAHMARERYTEALVAARRLLDALNRQDDPQARAAGEIAHGVALMACGRTWEARPSFARARRFLRAHGSPEDIALAYFNLGMAFGQLERFSLAKSAFRRSADLYGRIGRSKECRQSQVFLANCMMVVGDFVGAEAMSEVAGQDPALLEASHRVTLHDTESMVFLSQGQFGKAEKAMERAFRAAMEAGDVISMADSLYGLAKVKLRYQDLWAAQGLLLESYAFLPGAGWRVEEEKVRVLLGKTMPARRPLSLKRMAEGQPVRRGS